MSWPPAGAVPRPERLTAAVGLARRRRPSPLRTARTRVEHPAGRRPRHLGGCADGRGGPQWSRETEAPAAARRDRRRRVRVPGGDVRAARRDARPRDGGARHGGGGRPRVHRDHRTEARALTRLARPPRAITPPAPAAARSCLAPAATAGPPTRRAAPRRRAPAPARAPTPG